MIAEVHGALVVAIVDLHVQEHCIAVVDLMLTSYVAHGR